MLKSVLTEFHATLKLNNYFYINQNVVRPLPLQPYLSQISQEISLASKFTVYNLIHNLSCINTESITVTVLQHFLVNYKMIANCLIIIWGFLYTHQTCQKTLIHGHLTIYSEIKYNKNLSSNIKCTHPNFFILP